MKTEFLRANAIADRFDRIITQLKALANQANARYEQNANAHRSDAPVYKVGQRVFVSTKNMKTNRPKKKLDDKYVGPYTVLKVYKRAVMVRLPPEVKIFPVFHNSLLLAAPEGCPRPGQTQINEDEARKNRGRVLARDDDTDEIVEKWQFENILDSRNQQDGLFYKIQWKDHPPSWQPAADLKGCEQWLWEYHTAHPRKPGPPQWMKPPALPAPRPSAAPAPAPLRRSARLNALTSGMWKQVRFEQMIQVFL